MRDWLVPAAVFGVLAVPTVLLVRGTLHAPEIPTYPVTPVSALAAEPADGTLVGTRVHTLDATYADGWTYFDFSKGAVVPGSEGDEWDLAFQRSTVIVNGGDDFAGRGGIVDLGPVDFEAVEEVPADGYVETSAGRDSVNAAVRRWYDYSFTSHLLTPKPRVYAVRTADGRYAKLRFLSYYCPGPTPGCYTFEYAYQGDGGRRFR